MVNKKKIVLSLQLLLVLIVLYRIFSIDIFPITPNDSVHFLSETISYKYFKNPIEIFKPQALKYPGYPIYLTFWYELSRFVNLDFMTLTVFTQRSFLAIALVWMIISLHVYSIPLVIFMSSKHFAALTNVIYTEGMTIPFIMFFTLSMLYIYKNKNNVRLFAMPTIWICYLIMFITFLILLLTKITFAVMTLPLMLLIFNIKRNNSRSNFGISKTIVPTALIVIMAIVYIAGVSFENKKRHDVFSPVAGGLERLFYWGAWQQTFSVHPENRTNPELVKYYDNGKPFIFIHGIDKVCGSMRNVNCSAPILKKRALAMLDDAGLSFTIERIRCFVASLFGGEKVELVAGLGRTISTNGKFPKEIKRYNNNYYTKNNSLVKFFEKFNHGEFPNSIKGVSNSSNHMKLTEFRILQSILTLAYGVIVIWLIIKRKLNFHSPVVYAMLAYVVYAIGLASGLADVWRYVIPMWTMVMIFMSYGLKDALAVEKKLT